MDPETLEAHRTLAVQDETRVESPDPNLTDIETAALAALSSEDHTYLRLEQERLPLPFILSRLSRAMELRGPSYAAPALRACFQRVPIAPLAG
jgi:hypothetical protein